MTIEASGNAAPTLSNFDSIVSQRSAELEAKTTSATPPRAAKSAAQPAANSGSDSGSGSDSDSDNDYSEESEYRDDELYRDEDEGAEGASNDEADSDEADSGEAEFSGRAPLKALREALTSGRATPELMKAIGGLELEVQLPGGPHLVSVKDLQEGYMRQAHFSRVTAQVREVEAQAKHIINIERARTVSWQQDPSQLEQGLEAMGCSESAEKLFWKWLEEKHQYYSATPEQRRAFDSYKAEAKARAQERAELMEARRQLQAMQQQQQPLQDPQTQQAYQYLSSNTDRVLGAALNKAKAGRISNYTRNAFLNEVHAQVTEGRPLPEAMKEAAAIVADRFVEQRELANRQHAARRTPEVSQRRAPGGSTQAQQSQQNTQAKSRGKRSFTAADFGARFGID